MLFVMKYADQPDTRWRARNARNRTEARAQALSVAGTEWVEYGAVDPSTGAVELLGCVREDAPVRAVSLAM